MKKFISTFLAIILLIAFPGNSVVFADSPEPSVSVTGQYEDNGYYFLKINFENTPSHLDSLELGLAADEMYELDRFDQFSYSDIYNHMKTEGTTKTIYVCLSKSEAETLYVGYQSGGSDDFSSTAAVPSPVVTTVNELEWTGYDASDDAEKAAMIEANLDAPGTDTLIEVSDVLAKYNAWKGNDVSFNSSRAMEYRYPAVVLYEKLAGNFTGNLEEEMLKTLLFTSMNDSLYFGEPLTDTVALLRSYNFDSFNSLSENQELAAAAALRLYNGYSSDSELRDEIDSYITMTEFYTMYDTVLDSVKTAADAGLTTFNDGTVAVNIGESKQIAVPAQDADEKTIFDSMNTERLRAGTADIVDDGIIYGIEDGWGKVVYVKVNDTGAIESYSVLTLRSADPDLAVAASYRQEAGRINTMLVVFPKELDVTPAPPNGTAGGDVWDLDQLAETLTVGTTSVDTSSAEGSVKWITTQIAKVTFPATDIAVGETIKLDFVDTVQLKEDSSITIGSEILETEPTVADDVSPVGKIITKTGTIEELEVIFNELLPSSSKTATRSDAIAKIELYNENGILKEDCTSKAGSALSWGKKDGRDVMAISFSDPNQVTVGNTDYFKIEYTNHIKDYSGNVIDTNPKAIAIGGHMEEMVNSFTLGAGTRAILNNIREMAGGKTPKVAVTSSSSYGYQDSEDYYMSVELQAAYGFALMGMEPVMGGITVDTYDDAAIIAQTVKAFEDCTGMFGPGGDQAMNTRSYLEDDGSDTVQMRGLRQIFFSGGVVSGSSAGDHSLSNPMLNGGDSSSAVKNNKIEFSTADDYEAVPTDNVPMITPGFGFLQEYGLTDSHVNARGRLGRIIVALKLIPEYIAAAPVSGIELTSGITKGIGIGVDEDTAFSVVNGIGEVFGTSGVMITDISGATFPDTEMFTANNVKVSYLTAGDKYNFATKEVISSKSAAAETAASLTPSADIFPATIEAAAASGPEVLLRELIQSTSPSNYGEDVNNDSIRLTFSKDENTKGYYDSDTKYTVSQMKLDITLKSNSTGGGSGGSGGSGGKTADSDTGSTMKDAAGNVITADDLSKLEPKNGVIKISVVKKDGASVIPLNLEKLKALENESEGGSYQFDVNGLKYTLPFDALNNIEGLSGYIAENNLDPKNLELDFTVRPLTGTELEKAQQKNKLANEKGTLVSDFYDISLELLQNGKKLDADMTKFNDRVSFTIPTTEKGNAVFSFDPETGKFSFVPATFSESGATVRTAHHSIYVVTKNNLAFSDVKAEKWYASSIAEAANKGLVAGTGNNLFNPEGNVTRAQFVQMMANALQLPDAKASTTAYSDVSTAKWYYEAVMKAKSAGLLDKFTGEFKPEAAITREEMAMILAAAVRTENVAASGTALDLSKTFDDYSQFDQNNVTDIQLVCQLKIMQGTGKNFVPNGATTRAQAATVQLNLLKALGLID